MTFESLLKQVRNAGESSDTQVWAPPARLLALDPGGTCGWACFVDGKFTAADEIKDAAATLTPIEPLFDWCKPTQVVCEQYVLYPWKVKEQNWSDFPTVQLIGVIRFLCSKRDVSYVEQSAQCGKGFVTDEKLKEWGFYVTGKRHANDALRHVCYRLLFGK